MAEAFIDFVPEFFKDVKLLQVVSLLHIKRITYRRILETNLPFG